LHAIRHGAFDPCSNRVKFETLQSIIEVGVVGFAGERLVFVETIWWADRVVAVVE